MELVFLDRTDLSVLDFGYVGNSFTLVIDRVIPQKSSFTVNKIDINAKVGDLVVIRDKSINYIGIISTIDGNSIKQVTEVQTYDFISILDVDVKVNNYNGDISLFLIKLINDYYVTNEDEKQRLNYLEIVRDDNFDAKDKLEFEEDTIMSISSLVKSFNKSYMLGLKYELVYSRGRFSKIKLHITKAESGIVLRNDLMSISNLNVIDSNQQVINKLVFIPSDSNEAFKKTETYYLLTDGTITKDSTSNLRFNLVKGDIVIYTDEDYITLPTQAQTSLLETSLDHSITFDYQMDNKVAVPFKDFNVGDYIQFITPTKIYHTLITKIQFKNYLHLATITLGEYRISLTEQIILLKNSRR